MGYFEKINNLFSKVDKQKTADFYLTQNFIQDDCSCKDCFFYQNNCLNSQIEILNTIASYGVDLRKNLISEPTGVLVLLENDEISHCEVTYKLIGDFIKTKNNTFKLINENYKISVQIDKVNYTSVMLHLIIDKMY